LTSEGLAPITVYRAMHDGGDYGDEPLHLPFWVIAVDGASYQEQIDRITGRLQQASRIILDTDIRLDEEQIKRLAMSNPDLDIGLAKTAIVCEASTTKRLPTSSEIAYMRRRITESSTSFIYVPAFRSPNTFAYLKVGNLMTRRQPAYTMTKSAGLGRPVLCALRADEAVELMDYIFIATLPDSIQQNGDVLTSIHLEPDGSPRLVELPFERRGAHLRSCLGGFTISSRLVDGIPCADRSASPR
jgi:hypothetical protein